MARKENVRIEVSSGSMFMEIAIGKVSAFQLEYSVTPVGPPVNIRKGSHGPREMKQAAGVANESQTPNSQFFQRDRALP
jgi:hypothetical protein